MNKRLKEIGDVEAFTVQILRQGGGSLLNSEASI